MSTAETLHCPNCGAAAQSDATSCSFCGARLATVACPKCFGMMFVGEKFCSHCGALAQRTEGGASKLHCPHCKREMIIVDLGKTTLLECQQCQGMWLDVETLRLICTEKEEQAAVLGFPGNPARPAEVELNFRYIPCPVCGQIMNRFNFAHISGVVVDVCKPHGTWFDKDELRRAVDFIRAGGMDKARAREIADEAEQRARLAGAANAGIPASMLPAANAEFHSHAQNTAPGQEIADFAQFLWSLWK